MDYGTSASIIGTAFAVAMVIIKLPREESKQCTLHNVVIDNLSKDISEIKEWMVRIEGKVDRTG